MYINPSQSAYPQNHCINTTHMNPQSLVAYQNSCVQKIQLRDLDMTDYVTALKPGHDAMSNTAKQNISNLWERCFTDCNIKKLQGPINRTLNIAVVGAGIAGSIAMAVAALKGHKVTVLEKRTHEPIRENLITVNAKSRQIIESLREQAQAGPLFQTNGDLGFSERLPIKRIETYLQNIATTTAKPEYCEQMRGVEEPAISPQDSNHAQLAFKCDGRDMRLQNVDLVVIATGARSANPYTHKNSVVHQLFSVTPIHHTSALIYAKVRTQNPESFQHMEFNINQDMRNKCLPEQARFINAYTGYTPDSDCLDVETSLLFDAPLSATYSKEKMNKVLEDILPLLLNHEDTSIQTLAKALQGNQGIVQKGAAQVSHWIVDRAYALDMPVVAIGDAVCPPNPWTGSGANLAIASVEPLGQLMDDLSSSNTEDVDRTAFKIFDQKTKPIRMQALLRGTFASQIFERNHPV